MHAGTIDLDGRVTFDFAEFCRDYGHPAGLLVTFEVTRDAVVYVYARVMGEVSGDRVVFDLNSENRVDRRKVH